MARRFPPDTGKLKESLFRRMEEAIRLIELRRYHRILLAGRLPFIYALGVLAAAWLVGPVLFGTGGLLSGGARAGAYHGWAPGALFTATALAALLGGYLRVQSLWGEEQRLQTLHAWLLTRQAPGRVPFTTILMGALFGVAVTAAPALLGVVVGMLSGLRPWQYLVTLLLMPLCSLAGAAAGGAVFFINRRLVRRRYYYPGLAAVALVIFGLWFRIETVQNGWRRGWEEHPPRVVQALGLVSPAPYLFGVSAPGWWDAYSRPALGVRLPAAGAGLLYGVFMLGAAAYGSWLATRGYRRVAADPELIEEQPRAPTEDLGEEFYWRGFRNPVWTRDLRTRLRSKETAEFIFFASIAVAAGAFVPLLATAGDLSDPLQTAKAARQVFFWLTMTLVALIALVAPGLTAEVIAHERTTGTLEALVQTPLRPREILLGKLLGAASVLLVLMSPSLPLFGLCYLFHGASGGQVMGVYGLLFITLTVCAMIGVTQSAIHPKAGLAKFWAYACTAVFVAFPGGPLWLAALTAAPDAGVRQSMSVHASVGALMALFYAGFLVLFWGNACEQLEYSEY